MELHWQSEICILIGPRPLASPISAPLPGIGNKNKYITLALRIQNWWYGAREKMVKTIFSRWDQCYHLQRSISMTRPPKNISLGSLWCTPSSACLFSSELAYLTTSGCVLLIKNLDRMVCFEERDFPFQPESVPSIECVLWARCRQTVETEAKREKKPRRM